MTLFVVFFFLSYLIGSIPAGSWVTWLVTRQDIRTLGSGNIGATNVFRTVGKGWGVLVLMLDILKGFLPVFIFPHILKNPVLSDSYFDQLLLASLAVCGHNWPIFLKFKGGKGVATTTGAVLAIFPGALILAVLVWIALVFITGYVSVASIISSLSFLVWFVLLYRGLSQFVPLFVISALFISSIIFRHRSNIVRLMQGTEHRFKEKKK
jgi:glycerol-3-phosphate acyltransferase PlsY